MKQDYVYPKAPPMCFERTRERLFVRPRVRTFRSSEPANWVYSWVFGGGGQVCFCRILVGRSAKTNPEEDQTCTY